MSIQKLNKTFTSNQILHRSEMQAITNKIDEIISNLGSSSGGGGTTEVYSNVYYGVSTSAATAKTHTITVTDFQMTGETARDPLDGCVLFVKFQYAHTVDILNIIVKNPSTEVTSYTYEVKLNGGSIGKSDIVVGAVVCMVYDASDQCWNVSGGTGVALPVVYLPVVYKLKDIAGGKYAEGSGNTHISSLYSELSSNYAGHHLMMLFDTTDTFVQLDFGGAGDGDSLVFSTIHAGRYYEFSVSSSGVTMIYEGNNVVTAWDD